MTTPTAQRKSLRELRESTGTLFAKNNTPHKITCNTDTVSFELEPAGYDDSIRIVPKECLNVPGFQRLWMRNAISVSDDEEMENEITLLMGGQVAYAPKAQVQDEKGNWSEVEAVIEQPAGTNSITMAVDTDENSRTFGEPIKERCIIGGEPIYQRESDIKDGVPPLCELHAGEQHRVVSTPQADGSWTHQVVAVEAKKKGLA